ncbi:MAG: RDD family protein [Pseudomonadota bacterium]
MSEFNPYQAPGSDVEVIAGPQDRLAGRGQRLGAAIIDGIISLVFVVPVMMLMGTFEYTQQGEEPPFMLTLAATVFAFVVFTLVHFVFLKRYGQTIGKWMLNIHIADMEGNKAEVGTILFRRYLPISVVGLIPLVGQILPLVDILFIFRKDRRCVHDIIAGTQVLRDRGA